MNKAQEIFVTELSDLRRLRRNLDRAYVDVEKALYALREEMVEHAKSSAGFTDTRDIEKVCDIAYQRVTEALYEVDELADRIDREMA